MEEQLYNSIILIDEDENEIEFDIMDIIEHNGENYYVLLPVDDDSDELEFCVKQAKGRKKPLSVSMTKKRLMMFLKNIKNTALTRTDLLIPKK